MQELTKQYWVSVAAGKRLIAKAVLELPQLKQALRRTQWLLLLEPPMDT